MMDELLASVLQLYPTAASGPFGRDSTVYLPLLTQIPDQLREWLPKGSRCLVRGSIGKGKWATVPWVAVLDPAVTESTTEGFYPVYLFREDAKGVYLSLLQGITNVRATLGMAAARRELTRSAAAILSRVHPPASTVKGKLNLGLSGSVSGRAAFYEVGNIFAFYYEREAMPPASQLHTDFEVMMKIYTQLVDADLDAETIGHGTEATFMEDHRRAILHKRYERRHQAKIRKALGTICMACREDLTERYGALASGLIDVHHLNSVASRQGQQMSLRIRDFAVLCPNCHRMIHRLQDPSNLDALRALISQHTEPSA